MESRSVLIDILKIFLGIILIIHIVLYALMIKYLLGLPTVVGILPYLLIYLFLSLIYGIFILIIKKHNKQLYEAGELKEKFDFFYIYGQIIIYFLIFLVVYAFLKSIVFP